MRLKQILTTDGPGHSDYPRIDIKTHRSIARDLRWLGVIMAVIGVAAAVQTGDIQYGGVGVLLYFIASDASKGLRLEALEWELELEGKERDRS